MSAAMGEFFGAIPEVARAFWVFMDGFYGVAITVGSLVLGLLFGFLAVTWRGTHDWLAAISGMMAASVAFLWSFGILPSAFVYFVDSERDLIAGTLVPESLPAMDNFYQVLRDSIVIGQTGLFIVMFAVAMLMIQRRYPRTLAPGEEKGQASGGYR